VQPSNRCCNERARGVPAHLTQEQAPGSGFTRHASLSKPSPLPEASVSTPPERLLFAHFDGGCFIDSKGWAHQELSELTGPVMQLTSKRYSLWTFTATTR
jgi:hypothetical protein